MGVSGRRLGGMVVEDLVNLAWQWREAKLEAKWSLSHSFVLDRVVVADYRSCGVTIWCQTGRLRYRDGVH